MNIEIVYSLTLPSNHNLSSPNILFTYSMHSRRVSYLPPCLKLARGFFRYWTGGRGCLLACFVGTKVAVKTPINTLKAIWQEQVVLVKDKLGHQRASIVWATFWGGYKSLCSSDMGIITTWQHQGIPKDTDSKGYRWKHTIKWLSNEINASRVSANASVQ